MKVVTYHKWLLLQLVHRIAVAVTFVNSRFATKPPMPELDSDGRLPIDAQKHPLIISGYFCNVVLRIAVVVIFFSDSFATKPPVPQPDSDGRWPYNDLQK